MSAIFPTSPAWTSQALCAQVDPEPWFPEKGGSSKAALAVCGRCEVRAECLAWAMENDDAFGIFGGLTVTQRRAIRKAAA